MNIVISPDSFKGSLPATMVAQTIHRALLERIPDGEFTVLPMADGGEGTVDALIYATHGKKVEVSVIGPLGEQISTYYGVLGDDRTAILEVANTAGLYMVGKESDPMKRTTFGLGQALLHALKAGSRHFIIGLGGSATNDGGLGLLQALGVKFFNESGRLLSACGASMDAVRHADISGIPQSLKDSEITVACDVENVLLGKEGATFVYGPQKGLTHDQLAPIDQEMKKYASVVEDQFGKKVRDIPGAGAAGGLGFAFLLLGARLKSGAAIVAAESGLEEKIKACDFVITGEGKSDDQTLFGKVPIYVARLAKRWNKKAILISGSLGAGHEKLYDHFISCHSIIPRPMALEEAMKDVEPLLYDAAINIAGLLKVTR